MEACPLPCGSFQGGQVGTFADQDSPRGSSAATRTTIPWRSCWLQLHPPHPPPHRLPNALTAICKAHDHREPIRERRGATLTTTPSNPPWRWPMASLGCHQKAPSEASLVSFLPSPQVGRPLPAIELLLSLSSLPIPEKKAAEGENRMEVTERRIGARSERRAVPASSPGSFSALSSSASELPRPHCLTLDKNEKKGNFFGADLFRTAWTGTLGGR